MVPVVTLMAIGIGISGYYIDNQRILKEEQQQQQQEQIQLQNENQDLQKFDQIDEINDNKDTQSTTDNSSKSSPGHGGVQYVVDVDATSQKDKVYVNAVIEASEPGSCLISLKQGGFGPETEVQTVGGSCEAVIEKPGSGVWNVNVIYNSNDGKQTGSGSSTIEIT